MMKTNETKKVAKLVARNVKPIHEHDCPLCMFVGRLDGMDLYICQKPGQSVYRECNL